MSAIGSGDAMWPHFEPLWTELQSLGSKQILVAGGYGLFLKQRYLLENRSIPVIVPLEQWRETQPRATKDLDLIIGLALIADSTEQKKLSRALESHGFKVSEKNPRWQFEKRLSDTHTVVVDLHAPVPAPNQSNLHADKHRVKHKPSLGDEGIHGRSNPEAIGCELHPFEFKIQHADICVPNPVTWSIMKLTAAIERWAIAEDQNQIEQDRLFSREQAMKHAQDLCRIVAMVTRDERDNATSILDTIDSSPVFEKVYASKLLKDERIAVKLSASWNTDDFATITAILKSWFKLR